MITLNEYLEDSRVLEAIQYLKETENETIIDEGKITRAIKKLWNWLTGDDEKKYNSKQYYIRNNGSDIINGKIVSNQETTHKGIFIKPIQLSKVEDALSTNRELYKKLKPKLNSETNYYTKALLLTDGSNKVYGVCAYTDNFKYLPAFNDVEELDLSNCVLIIGLEYDGSIIKEDDDALMDVIITAAVQAKKQTIIILPAEYKDPSKEGECKKIYKKLKFTTFNVNGKTSGKKDLKDLNPYV